jgi:hypothetical protein
MTIGATTAVAGSFTNLSVTGTTSFDGSEGTAGQVLTSAGTGVTPTWTTPTTGTVTSVTGTSPVVSSGGSTPAISMPAATGSVNGYLTSTDWTTFNSKGSGTVTSVAATVPSFLSVAGSPITSSGTLALTYSGTALPIANGGTGLTAVGTNGQVLQSNGSALVFATPSAGAVTLISTQTASSSTSVSWTGLTGYNNYLLIISGIEFPANDYLVVEFGTGGTPTYITTGYFNVMTAVDVGTTTTVNRYSIANFSKAMLSNPNQPIRKTNSVCYIFGMTNSQNTALSFQSNGATSVPAYGSYVGQSTLTDTTAKTAIRISGGSSNTFSGTLSLYGISS